MNEQEFDRLLAQTFADQRISDSTYCGTCGYNLRTRSYVGICPECGYRYNARPLKMENIFIPYGIVFPYSEVVSAALGIGLGIALVRGAISSGDASRATFGLIFAALGITFAVRAVLGVRQYRRARAVLKRIEAEAEE
ncbi:MAG TPA: hypothetical protein VGM03_12895 [Phycisphaerae bacterium]|jgi:hypothetical protein